MRRLILPSVVAFALVACAEGDGGRQNPIFTSSTGNNNNDTAEGSDMEGGDGDTGDGDGDSGDGDGDSGDGDGEPTTGDGDGDPTDEGNAVCGNGEKEAGEECDGNDLGGLDCTDLGFEDGSLVCADDCTLLDAACSTCGDGQLSPTEECDGSNFGGLTCVDLGFAGGNLGCAADCKSVLQSGCMQAPTCGNGSIDNGEQCDGGNLNGNTCQQLGFDGGSLSCTAGCMLNTANCTANQCTDLLGACQVFNDTCCEGLFCAPGFGCLPE